MTVESENATLSFGRYLQSIRIERGISLRAVAQETRIRPETLHFIEEENHRRLPDEVYVKGFLRAYAKAIGADADEAVQRYNSRLAVKRRIALSEADLYRSGGAFWRRLLLALGAVLCLIVATLYAVSAWREHSPPKPEVATETTEAPAAEPAPEKQAAVSTAPAIEKAAPTPANEPGPAPAMEPAAGSDAPALDAAAKTAAASPAAPDKLRLTIDTIEETWLKIIVDDQRPKQYRLYPGDHIELEGARNFNLLIGNAAGVRLDLNGKAVTLSGKSGQVVNILLP